MDCDNKESLVIIPEDTLYSCMCIDNSGSTSSSQIYWNKVYKIFNQNRNAKIIFWNSTAMEVPLEIAEQNIKLKYGSCGTTPACFVNLLAKHAINNKINKLIIITDGEIGMNEVNKCRNALQESQLVFNEVETYFQSNNNSQKFDTLSVTSAFSCNTDFKFFVNDEPPIMGSSKHKILLESYFDQPSLFINDLPQLRINICVQNNGILNTQLRDDLLELKSNLLSCCAKLNNKYVDWTDELRILLEKGEHYYNDALDVIKKQCMKDDNIETRLEKIIDEEIMSLVNLCNGVANYQFSALQSRRVQRAQDVRRVSANNLDKPDLDILSVDGVNYECPIMMDADVPCLLISHDEPVLAEVDKTVMDQVMNNPLLFLRYPHLVNKLISRFDHIVGLNTVVNLFSSNQKAISPFTRKALSSALTFHPSEIHHKSNDFTMATLLFGTKLVGNKELWFIVFYHILSDIALLPSYLKTKIGDYKSQLDNYVKDRLITRYCNITLSGLSIFPLMKVPAHIALWYCVVSPWVLSPVDYASPSEDRLRELSSSMCYILPILDLLGYYFNRKLVCRYISLYNGFYWLRNKMVKDNEVLGKQKSITNKLKKKKYKSTIPRKVAYEYYKTNKTPMIIDSISENSITNPLLQDDTNASVDDDAQTLNDDLEAIEKTCNKARYYMNSSELLRIHYQQSVLLDDGSRMFIDSPIPTEKSTTTEFYKFYAYKRCENTPFYITSDDIGLSLVDLFKLLAHINLNERASVFKIDDTFNEQDEHYLPIITSDFKYTSLNIWPVKICEETMRPYTYSNGCHWKSVAAQVYGEAENILNCNNLFGKYVCRFNNYPTKSQLLKYIQNKYKNKNFPIHIVQLVEATIDDYHDIIQKYEPCEFRSRYMASNNIKTRESLENANLN